MDALQGQAPASGLSGGDGPFQPGGPSFFNQNPRQLSTIVLFQGAIPITTWTLAVKVPKASYMTIQDFWIFNRGGSPMSCFYAMVASGSAWLQTGGTNQDDVFQICSGAVAYLRESNTDQVAIHPNQALWFYSSQPCNMRISGIKVDP